METNGRNSTPKGIRTPEAFADQLGVSVLALKILCGMGCPGPYDYSPVATSEEEAGQLLGVSGRTIAVWKKRGMPWSEGRYVIDDIENWRLSQDWEGDQAKRRDWSALLVQGFFRVIRTELCQALHAEIVANGDVSSDLTDRLKAWILDDAEIVKLTEELQPR